MIVARLLPPESNFGSEIKFEKNCLNEDEDVIRQNILANIQRDVPVVKVHHAQPELEVAILGGGPSLVDLVDELKAFPGYVIGTNGATRWAVEQGINVRGHVQVDAREFNRRFVDPPMPGLIYYLASQVHPSLFDVLEGEKVRLFHGGTARMCEDEVEAHYGEKPIIVKIGSTVVLSSMWVMYLLGFRKIHLYGVDSCLMGGEHHAYSQPENDKSGVLSVNLNGREFLMHPWMLSQLQDFLGFMKFVAEDFDLQVHGDGVIAYAIQQLSECGELRLLGE